MIVDREWVQRDLGFDPIATPAPAGTFTIKEAAKPSSKVEDFQREIIEFDSEAPEGRAFFAFTSATGMSRATPSGSALIGRERSAARKSYFSNPTRTCPRTGRSCRTLTFGSRSLPKFNRSWC